MLGIGETAGGGGEGLFFLGCSLCGFPGGGDARPVNLEFPRGQVESGGQGAFGAAGAGTASGLLPAQAR